MCEPASVFGYESVDLVAGVLSEMAEAARSIRRTEVAELLAVAGVDCQPLIHVEIGGAAVATSIRDGE